MTFPLPVNETGRLSVLEELQLPDTSAEPAFDDLTSLAADICETPMALISIVDQTGQWFKSRVGVDITHTPREQAFCNYTICQDELFIVPDALADRRFAQNPLVTGQPCLRFYAGAPLVTSDGHAVGTLCVLDRVPRVLTERQQRALRVLSRHVVAQLELRRHRLRHREAQATLALENAELERRVSHRTSQLLMLVKKAEAAKRDVLNMVERMSDGMVALDPQWRFDYVNAKAAELIGLAAVEMLGQRLTEVFPEAADHPFLRGCEEAARQERPFQCEVFYERRGLWFDVRCYPSKEGISFFFQDITQRKETEKRLDHERKVSDTIIASLPGTFYVFDQEGKFLRWNDLAENATGLRGEAFSSTHPVAMIVPEDREGVGAAIQKSFETGSALIEARLHNHETGLACWHLLTGRSIDIDDRKCLLGIGIDISDRKEAQHALEEARSRLEVAVRASGIGFWSWEVASNLMYTSTELKRQMGFEDTDFGHQDFWDGRVHPEDLPRVMAATQERLQRPPGEFEHEYRMLHRDGQYRWVLSRSRLYCDAAGRPERILGCHIDVTERRAMLEALHASGEQLRALAEHQHSVREVEAGRIARELHDEMGAALTALKLDVGWVDRQLARFAVSSLVEPVRARLASINTHVDGIIDSMHKVCHALRPAVLDQLGLAAAIDWQCAEFEKRTGVHCRVERDDSFPLDDARRTAIFRILQELLTNVARHAQATEVTLTAGSREEEFLLTVADNGCGLPADAFARPNNFGLVGVRERALAAGGRVTFVPSLGGGTTVKVSIPTLPERNPRK